MAVDWLAMVVSLREAMPRQVDKKSGVAMEQEEEKEKGVWGAQGEDRGLEFSRRRERQTSFFFFPLTFLKSCHIKRFCFCYF